MDPITTKFITPGIIFILTLASGFWLGSSGKPINTLIFTIHKLIALAAVVTTAIQVYGIFKNVHVQVLPITLVVLAGLCVIALFATGALISQAKPVSDILLTIHKVTPFLAVVSMAVTVYLFAGSTL